MTIIEILQLEPQLKTLADLAASMPKGMRHLTYSATKVKIDPLVGWGARRPELRSAGAYLQYIEYLCDRMDY